ncbi:hypothetical protein GQL56_21705 [Pseudomonas putida]|nr:hypothetical protein [Pseudomonas putida]
MSLDGGYNGSFQQAIANLHIGRDQGLQEGRRQGHEEGRMQGYDQGRRKGRSEGRSEGYSEGWQEGAARANEKLQPLRDMVRQYFGEAVQLRAQVQHQQELIELMHAQLSRLAQAGGAGRDVQQPDLTATVATLQNANQLKDATIEAMEKQFQSTSAQSRLNTRQYHCALVFMRAAQGVLEEFVDEDTPEAEFIREQFVSRYQQQVAQSLSDGDIDVAPELDEAFQRLLPRTQQFILHMLQSAASR